MKIFYPYPEPLDETKARHVQAWRTADALAERHDLEMAVADRCEFAPQREKHKLVIWPRAIRIGPLKISIQRRFIDRAVLHCMRLPEDAVIYVRHLKLADAILASRPGQRVVFEVHEFFSQNAELDPRRSLELQKMEGRVFVGCAGLVCITRGLVDALRERYLKLPPITVAADACDPAPFLTQTVVHDGGREPVDLIYAGSLHPWKGVETLVQAMAYLPDRRLRVVGGTDEEVGHLRLIARRWRVADRCEFTGRLAQREVWKHLRRAKIGVVPNVAHAIGTAFTSPLKVFEYLAAGKPVLASDLPSLREVLDEDVAKFFPPRSPRSLATAAEKLLSDESALSRMGEAARLLARNHTWTRRADRIGEFIAGLSRAERS